MGIKLETDYEATIASLIDNVDYYRKNLKLQIFRALTVLEVAIKQNIRSKSGLHVRTGRLLNSVTKKIDDSGDTITGEVGTEGVPYASIHEFGGTIKPKNAKALTIPLDGNRRNDGSPIITISEVFNTKKAFVTRNGVVLLKNGKTSVQPMFVFKKSVDIPARPYMAPALAAKKDQILKDFGLFLVASFTQGKSE